MKTDIGLSIGGFSFLVRGSSIRTSRLSRGRYAEFRHAVTTPDIVIELLEEPVSAEDLPAFGDNISFDSGTVWRLLESDGTRHILLSSPAGDGIPYRIATFQADCSRCVIASVAGSGADGEDPADYDPLEFPLSEILMVCLLSAGKGLMVHACGVSDEGRGFLFPGNSTNGKTTMARQWRDFAAVLNDDRIILRQADEGFIMYGTPWHGDLSDVSAQGVRLSSVDFLHHGDCNRSRRLGGAEAVSMLLKRSFLPLWDRKGMEFTLDFCSRIAASVPFYSLDFLPDRSIVRFLRCRA